MAQFAKPKRPPRPPRPEYVPSDPSLIEPIRLKGVLGLPPYPGYAWVPSEYVGLERAAKIEKERRRMCGFWFNLKMLPFEFLAGPEIYIMACAHPDDLVDGKAIIPPPIADGSPIYCKECGWMGPIEATTGTDHLDSQGRLARMCPECGSYMDSRYFHMAR